MPRLRQYRRYLNGYPYSSANIVCRACDLNMFLTILLSETIHPGPPCECNEQEHCSRVVRCKYLRCQIFCGCECYLYDLARENSHFIFFLFFFCVNHYLYDDFYTIVTNTLDKYFWIKEKYIVNFIILFSFILLRIKIIIFYLMTVVRLIKLQ